MDILVGSENGQLQAVNFENFSINTSNSSQPKANLAVLPLESGIKGTGYPAIIKTVRCDDLLWIARQGGAVEAFLISKKLLTEAVVFPFSDGHKIVGLFLMDSKKLVAVSEKAEVAIWSPEDCKISTTTLQGMNNVQAAAFRGSLLAVGGKESKNNLKVFDLSKEDFSVPIYSAKPTMNTRLYMHFLVDIRAICFLGESNNSFFAVSNADGQIFTYDFSLQASSTSHHQVMPKKALIRSLSRAEKDGSVVFTDASGVIECYDLVVGKSYGRFKPHEGAVLSFTITAKNLIILTASKDRFLRIFNYSTRQLLHKVYLKHAPSTITIISEDWLAIHEQDYEDSCDEEVWEGMTAVADTKKKRAKLEK